MPEIDLERMAKDIQQLKSSLSRAATRYDLDMWQQNIEHTRNELVRRVERIEQESRNARNELIDAVQAVIEQIRAEQAQAEARFDRRLGVVERYIRVTGGASAVSLANAELEALARRAERGRTLSGGLLGAEGRAAEEDTARGWEAWQQRHRDGRRAALAASRTIATTAPGDEGRAEAERAFRTARATLAELEAGRERTREAAEEARRALERDDTERGTHAEVIADGDRAWTELTDRLRSRIDQAVQHTELLPAWFADAVGLAPPRGQGEAWREAGVEVAAYRLTYGIDDPAVPLGPAPGIDDPPRWSWYMRLSRSMERFRP